MSRLVAESRAVRRIVGQLEPGEELIHGLLSVCGSRNVRCGLIRASGVLEELSVVHYEPPRKAMGEPVRFRGPMSLVWASGSLSELGGKLDLRLQVVVSRQRDNGIEMLGGDCSGARVTSCEFVIEALDDLLLRRSADRRTGLYQWSDVISALPPEAPPKPPPAANFEAPASPAEIVERAPEVTPEPEPPPPEPEPEPEELEPFRAVQAGDKILHAQFGECIVQRVSVDHEYATVRREANKRLVRLSLEVLDLHYQHEEDGHQVFEARPAARR